MGRRKQTDVGRKGLVFRQGSRAPEAVGRSLCCMRGVAYAGGDMQADSIHTVLPLKVEGLGPGHLASYTHGAPGLIRS